MAKFKPLNENQLVMLPISLQNQLVPGTLEHTISELVDKHMDLSVFEENSRLNYLDIHDPVGYNPAGSKRLDS